MQQHAAIIPDARGHGRAVYPSAVAVAIDLAQVFVQLVRQRGHRQRIRFTKSG
jgi:hypothetical protein